MAALDPDALNDALARSRAARRATDWADRARVAHGGGRVYRNPAALALPLDSELRHKPPRRQSEEAAAQEQRRLDERQRREQRRLEKAEDRAAAATTAKAKHDGVRQAARLLRQGAPLGQVRAAARGRLALPAPGPTTPRAAPGSSSGGHPRPQTAAPKPKAKGRPRGVDLDKLAQRRDRAKAKRRSELQGEWRESCSFGAARAYAGRGQLHNARGLQGELDLEQGGEDEDEEDDDAELTDEEG